jgi:hypothetical protein
MRSLLVFYVILFALPAHAERATERYAPAQISVARDLLDHARAAAAVQQYATAAKYARQAQVDARIAWGMTDADALRAEAAGIMRDATALVANGRGAATASYPPAEARTHAASPIETRTLSQAVER